MIEERWLRILEACEAVLPDQAFDQHWAAALLNEVLECLQREYQRDGKDQLFATLRQTLVGTRESQPYGVLARQLGISEGAVRTAVHRLRRRYRELIREEIANTVSSPAEVEQEMRYLLTISAR